MKLIGMLADHPTPKISEESVAFTLNSRDYKGVMVVIYEQGKGATDGNCGKKTHTDRVQQTSKLS